MKNKLLLKNIKKLKSGSKKYEATFIREKNGKKKEISTKFGAAGMSDYTIHKDIERRNRYIKRHKKDLKTKDPSRAGFLSMFILWNKKTYKASLTDYKRRLNTYNRTGKFPIKIDNDSNKMKFGKYKYKVPDNVKDKKLYLKIKKQIEKKVKSKNRKWGAYDSGQLVTKYKQQGGKYSGKKEKTKGNLSRWYKEKWVDACAWPKIKSCGRTKSKEKITYCRPSKYVDSNTPKLIQELTKAQIKSRCKRKKSSPKKNIH